MPKKRGDKRVTLPGNETKSFVLGRLLATPGALREIPEAEIRGALRRHAIGDWGEVSEADGLLNDVAVVSGGRVVSAYVTDSRARFWIITEACSMDIADHQLHACDRASTTLLLPEEY